MSHSFTEALATHTEPTAYISLQGELLAVNPAGKMLFEEAPKVIPRLLASLSPDKPTRRLIRPDLILQADWSPDGTHVVLTWQTLSEAEIRLELFRAVAQSVNSSLILEDIFDALGDVLQTFLPFTSGTLMILDESQNAAKVTVALDEYGHANILNENPGFTGYDPLIRDLLGHPEPQRLTAPLPESVLLNAQAIQALVVPLVSKGLVLGCLALSGDGFTVQQMQLLAEVTEPLAIAIENARLYWQTQSQASREFLINQITKSIRESLDIRRILQTTAQEVGKVLGLSRCLIHYWEQTTPEAEQYEYVLPGIPPIGNPEAFAETVKTVFSRRASSEGQYNPFVLNDIRSYGPGMVVLEAEKLKSLAVFPILLEKTRFVGAISLHQCDAYRTWLTEDLELLKAIAEHVAVALHQAHLFSETERQRRELETTLNELQQTQMQLIQSEKMAVLGQFVAGIAHEVNTPLGTLMANDNTVRYCLEQIRTEDEKTGRFRQSALDLLDINRMAGERIQEIVRNLRNFARLDESDLKYADLHEGLDATLLLVGSEHKSRITVHRKYGTGIPKLECFPGLLNQVFMNMIVNAIHSIEGKGTITLRTRYEEIPSPQITVEIEDTGKGISPEHLSRIFDPGFTTKGVGVGTGLGLALCYKIVQKHHGRIDVTSTPGRGTCMRVVLPVRHTQPA